MEIPVLKLILHGFACLCVSQMMRGLIHHSCEFTLLFHDIQELTLMVPWLRSSLDNVESYVTQNFHAFTV